MIKVSNPQPEKLRQTQMRVDQSDNDALSDKSTPFRTSNRGKILNLLLTGSIASTSTIVAFPSEANADGITQYSIQGTVIVDVPTLKTPILDQPYFAAAKYRFYEDGYQEGGVSVGTNLINHPGGNFGINAGGGFIIDRSSTAGVFKTGIGGGFSITPFLNINLGSRIAVPFEKPQFTKIANHVDILATWLTESRSGLNGGLVINQSETYLMTMDGALLSIGGTIGGQFTVGECGLNQRLNAIRLNGSLESYTRVGIGITNYPVESIARITIDFLSRAVPCGKGPLPFLNE